MLMTEEEVARRVERLIAALASAGLRVTHQRLEVAREIAASDTHPDVESVYRAVHARIPTISLDTVYRTLGALAEIGAIQRVTATVGPARYEANLTGHHHFVCTRCGAIHDVVDSHCQGIGDTSAGALFGTVQTVDVHYKGVCRECLGAASS
jgi:Fur family peroxide stress response transcriptional regulator